MPATTGKWHRWKRNRIPQEVKRVPLDKCSVPLWKVFSVLAVEKLAWGKKISHHVITLEYFRGQQLWFIWKKDHVIDLRDKSTMTHDAFRKFVQDRTHTELKLP